MDQKREGKGSDFPGRWAAEKRGLPAAGPLAGPAGGKAAPKTRKRAAGRYLHLASGAEIVRAQAQGACAWVARGAGGDSDSDGETFATLGLAVAALDRRAAGQPGAASRHAGPAEPQGGADPVQDAWEAKEAAAEAYCEARDALDATDRYGDPAARERAEARDDAAYDAMVDAEAAYQWSMAIAAAAAINGRMERAEQQERDLIRVLNGGGGGGYDWVAAASRRFGGYGGDDRERAARAVLDYFGDERASKRDGRTFTTDPQAIRRIVLNSFS